MKVHFDLIYPAVNRQWPNPSDTEKHIPVTLNIGCDSWKTSAAMRKGFCDLIFAGAGNHPGLWDGVEGQPFDAGDEGTNRVHRQWKVARTRSMSVGDIVCIDPRGLCEFWVCDSAGWVLLTPEQAESWLKWPRKYGCDSFDLHTWMKATTGVSTII